MIAFAHHNHSIRRRVLFSPIASYPNILKISLNVAVQFLIRPEIQFIAVGMTECSFRVPGFRPPGDLNVAITVFF